MFRKILSVALIFAIISCPLRCIVAGCHSGAGCCEGRIAATDPESLNAGEAHHSCAGCCCEKSFGTTGEVELANNQRSDSNPFKAPSRKRGNCSRCLCSGAIQVESFGQINTGDSRLPTQKHFQPFNFSKDLLERKHDVSPALWTSGNVGRHRRCMISSFLL